MNDITKFSGGSLPANPSDLATGLANVGMGIQTLGSQPILRLLREGIYVFGQENIEVMEGSQWAVNPYSIEHGWACWGDGEMLGEVMVPFNQQPPAIGSLPDHGEPWAQQNSMQLMCMTGEDKGVTVVYKSTSKGFLNMFKKLTGQIINQVQVDSTHIVPLVELDTDHYNHKKFGKIYTPVLEVVDWLEMDTGEPAEAEADPEPEEKPKRRGRKAKAEPAAEAEIVDEDTVEDSEEVQEEAAPRRRRRRRA